MWRFLNNTNENAKLYRGTEYIPISFLTSSNRNSYCVSSEFKANWRSTFNDTTHVDREDFMEIGVRTLFNDVLIDNSQHSVKAWSNGNTTFIFRESVILDFYTKYCPVVVLTVKLEDFLELKDLPELTFDILSPKLVAVASEDLSGFHYTKLRKHFKDNLGLNPNKHVIKVPVGSFIEMFFKLDYSVMGIHFYDREYQESVLTRALENLKSRYSTITETSATEESSEQIEESTTLRVIRQEVSEDSMSKYYYLSNGLALQVERVALFEMFDGDDDTVIQVHNQILGLEEAYDDHIPMNVSYWNDANVFIISHEEADEILAEIRREVEREAEEDEDIEIFDDEEPTSTESTSDWIRDINNLSVAGSESINNGTLYTMSNSNRIWFPNAATDAEVIEAYQELVAPDIYGIWGWGEAGVRLISTHEYTSWINQNSEISVHRSGGGIIEQMEAASPVIVDDLNVGFISQFTEFVNSLNLNTYNSRVSEFTINTDYINGD